MRVLKTSREGRVGIDGKDVTFARPTERGIAMVFQSYALYPHMSVAQNIGFALKMAKVAPAAIKATTTAVTLAAGSIAVPALTVAGILGLAPRAGAAGRPPGLYVGHFGHQADLLRTTLRRMASASRAPTAGYLAPMIMLIGQLPDAAQLGSAFAVGGGAQRVLLAVLARIAAAA